MSEQIINQNDLVRLLNLQLRTRLPFSKCQIPAYRNVTARTIVRNLRAIREAETAERIAAHKAAIIQKIHAIRNKQKTKTNERFHDYN